LLNRPSINIAFSTEALKANLSRLENEWDACQNTRDRDGIYSYLTAVFELGRWWAHERKAIEYARRALWLRGHRTLVKEPEPFAAVIFCTADPEKVDYRMRSKWSRVLRYAALYKDLDEPLQDFIKRKGSINKCATRYTRRLGRGAPTQQERSTGDQHH
jgi:hypothetical protein